MKAEIVLLHPARGMLAAKNEDVGFVIIELLGSYSPEIGNIIAHPDFTSMGSERYRNLSTGEDMDVYVQNIVGTLDSAKKQCFLK